MPDGRLLLEAVDAALKAVDGRRRVRDSLSRHPIDGPVWLIAVGKAASAMSQGAVDALGDRIAGGLVITKRGLDEHFRPALSHMTYLAAGHPLPDDASLMAGRRLIEILERTPADATLLFLISGGASALVEVLSEGVTLADLRRANQWLLGSGWDITAVNGLRRRFSRIKGGRLAQWVRGRRTYNLLISDVPGDDPAFIGSGLLVPDHREVSAPTPLPPWLGDMLRRLSPAPTPEDAWFSTVITRIVATPAVARRAAAAYLRARGCPVHCHTQLLREEIHDAAAIIDACLRAGPGGVHIWSGEPTVLLPEAPGRGGRNQSLALAVARVIRGEKPRFFLSVGSDGNDGMTEDAGALVDNNTVREGEGLGLDASDALRRADAGSYLEAVGALVHTGPTGTNVMDLMLAMG